MRKVIHKFINDYKCQNISCNNDLTSFEISRQTFRNLRYRFCRHCRQLSDRKTKLIWKCRCCSQLLDRTHYLRGAYYCKSCAHIEGTRKTAKLKIRKGSGKIRMW